jgi:hypothetical protein
VQALLWGNLCPLPYAGRPAPSWSWNDAGERIHRPDQDPALTPGSVSSGAKVDGVAIELSAFGVMTAGGAAFGLKASGLTEEAEALGLIRFGPVAAGAEPGMRT